MRASGSVWAVLLSLFTVACGGEPAKLSELEQEILTPSCVFSSCHGGAAPAGGLSLVSPTYAALVDADVTEAPGKKRVVAGSLEASYLLNKLEARDIASGTEMPPGQPLSEERLERIRSWIEAGAPND